LLLTKDMNRIALADRARFGALFALHCHFRESRALSHRLQRLRHKIARQLQQKGPTEAQQVERVRDITPQEFKRRYVLPGRPVLLEGAASDWACSRRWSFEFLREHCGDQIVKIVQRAGLATEEPVGDKEYSHEMAFRSYVDQLLEHGKTYLRFSPLLETFPELLQDLDLRYLKSLRPTFSPAAVQTFIGGKGTQTPFHCALSPGLFVNVAGVKHWKLIPCHYTAIMNPSQHASEAIYSELDPWSPDLQMYPGFDCITPLEVIQHPGDILYFPSWMWHHVKNLEHSIGVRYGSMNIHSALFGSPAFTYVRTFAARPSLLKTAYATFRRSDIDTREEGLLTPGLIDDW
jgi:hypothetical protein